MTLLLGPPSSGKTTFLRALAGKSESNLKVCVQTHSFEYPNTNKKNEKVLKCFDIIKFITIHQLKQLLD